jgi:hypothetical protein
MGCPHSPMVHDSYFIVIATTYLWMASEGTLVLMSIMTMAFYRVVLRGEGVENDPREHNRLSMSPIRVCWIFKSGLCTICITKSGFLKSCHTQRLSTVFMKAACSVSSRRGARRGGGLGKKKEERSRMLFRALAAARANLEPDARVTSAPSTIIYVEEKARSESFRKTL